jgi:Ricin-type beta-trefoil lectin domain-like
MRRTRGSWTPRIIGIGAVVLVAIFGAIVYLVASPARASRHPEQLSTRVQSFQTVGLVGQIPAGHSTALRLLGISNTSLAFGPMPPTSLPQGDPQWTADTMVGGTYVFIYAPSGKCLAATGQGATLSLQRCDLGAGQRWQRASGGVQSGGHEYDQYRNLASGQCLATGSTRRGGRAAAGLAVCARQVPARQLVSFWWSA